MNPLPWSRPLPPGSVAVAYTGGVQLGAHVMERLAPYERERVLRGCSTNVDNLDAGHWGTLLSSALVVEEPMPLPYALLLVAALGYTEYAYGAWWTAAAFLFGHACATLLVHTVLRRTADTETRRALDVGTSYGLNTVLGVLTSALPRGTVRGVARVGLLALAAAPVLRRGRTFTDVGHLVALGVGVGLSLAADRLSGARPRENVLARTG
ncbi:rhomboid-like protein [Streptomyces sp. NPDC060010]|uniref:rhomboid-like protein n=1 Tax=Streptomyces sp. NPDC060010 TaxID=3347036 RepID=UPI0036769A19